jgi:hypothetical protein
MRIVTIAIALIFSMVAYASESAGINGTGTIDGKSSSGHLAICDQFLDFTNLSRTLYLSGDFITQRDILNYLETNLSELHTTYPDLSLDEMQMITLYVPDPGYMQVTRFKDYKMCKKMHKNGKHPNSLFN